MIAISIFLILAVFFLIVGAIFIYIDDAPEWIVAASFGISIAFFWILLMVLENDTKDAAKEEDSIIIHSPVDTIFVTKTSIRSGSCTIHFSAGDREKLIDKLKIQE